MSNLEELEVKNVCSLSCDAPTNMCSLLGDHTCRDNSCTTSYRFVKILDLREGNEESSEKTTGCKASVYAEFDDCPRVGKLVKLLDFRHFVRFFSFDRKEQNTLKKSISDVINVSVVLDVECGNIPNCR